MGELGPEVQKAGGAVVRHANCRQNPDKQTEVLVLVPIEKEPLLLQVLAQTTGERAPKHQLLAWAPQSPPEPVGSGKGELVSRAPSHLPLSGVHGPFILLFPARPCPPQQDPIQRTHLPTLSIYIFLTLQKKSRMAHISSALVTSVGLKN